MKRSREEMSLNSRPQPCSVQPPMTSGSNGHSLTTNDALTYLKSVKDMFKDSREKYKEFLEVLKDFKAQRIQTAGVIERVKDLFKGHRELILGFNTFLPKGCRITLSPEDEATPVKKQFEFQEAIRFVKKVKTTCQGDDSVYKAFLDILKVYRKENKPITEVYQEVSALFSQQPDLLSEFKQFFPDSTATTLPYHASKNSLSNCEGNSALPSTRHLHIEKMPITLHDNRDGNIDHPDVVTDRDPRDRKLEDRIFDHKGQQFSQELKSSSRIEHFADEQFRKGGENGENSGSRPNPSSNGDKSPKGAGMYSREFSFCEKVREIFCNSDGYEEFMKFLDAHGKGDFPQSDLENQVRNLFVGHQDLVEGFVDTFPHSGSVDGFLAAMKKKSARPLKVADRDSLLERERIDGQNDREQGVAFGNSNGSSQRMSLHSKKDKYASKPIHELDLSDCDQCTPSYRLLPKDYPIPLASQKTEIGRAVLNDNWVSVTSGSEDYSFKHMHKNQYEEILFLCEDDRFELDMLLGSVSAATERVEDLLNKITDNSVATDSNFCINDHLTALNLRCIERIYGDHSLDVMDVLKKNAPLALPVILTRLKQKQEEWARCRSDFNKVWAEIYAKNHHKSLDHRSFYFKQQDTKSLGTKALLAEIKELREKKTEDDYDMLLATTIGNREPVIPEMEFEYPDPEIHDDVYKLIKYSCGEVCSSEQLDKVLNIWTTFLELILGVPRRAQRTKDDRDVLISNNHISVELNPIRNENVRIGILNGENGVGEDGPKNLDTSLAGKSDEILRIGTRDNLNGNSIYGVTASGHSAVSARQGNAGGLVRLELRPNGEHVPSLGGREIRRRVAPTNAVTTKATEREEGELSPNRAFEDDSFATYRNGDVAEAQVLDGKNDADDKGSGTRLREDNENAYENGDVTGSECNNPENENTIASESEVFKTAKPLRKHVNQASRARERNSRIFYGNDSIYVLFRLHQALYERIQTAKVNVSVGRWRGSDDSYPTDLYARFLSSLYNLLDGSYDNTKFEDECRAIIGTQSYNLFTLDKLIFKIVKQLQAIATAETENNLFLLYAYENSRKRETFEDVTYYQNVSVLLQEENIYRIECLSSSTRMSIQLVEADAHEKPEGTSMDPKFMDYIFHDYLPSISEHKASGLFLKRKRRRYLDEDQYSAVIKEIQLVNGLEIRISPTSYKGQYVLGTEDVLFRPWNKRRTVQRNGFSHDLAKSSNKLLSGAQRYNKWLSSQIDNLTR